MPRIGLVARVPRRKEGRLLRLCVAFEREHKLACLEHGGPVGILRHAGGAVLRAHVFKRVRRDREVPVRDDRHLIAGLQGLGICLSRVAVGRVLYRPLRRNIQHNAHRQHRDQHAPEDDPARFRHGRSLPKSRYVNLSLPFPIFKVPYSGEKKVFPNIRAKNTPGEVLLHPAC